MSETCERTAPKNILGLTRPFQKLADRYGINHDVMYIFVDRHIHDRIPNKETMLLIMKHFDEVSLELGIDAFTLRDIIKEHIAIVLEDMSNA